MFGLRVVTVEWTTSENVFFYQLYTLFTGRNGMLCSLYLLPHRASKFETRRTVFFRTNDDID